MTIAADLHTLTGAYAAHALDGPEKRAFEHHLRECEACSVEVREFQETLARFGAAESVAPPPAMKARVLAAAATVRQLPPVTVPAGAEAGVRGRWARTGARLALAASVAAAATLGAVAVQQHQQAEQAGVRATRLQTQQERLTALLSAPDARTSTVRSATATGTVVWAQSRGEAGFLADGLPALAHGTTYELWFDDAGTMRPAGLLPASSGTLLLNGQIHHAAGVGVTVEPAGGSLHPSGQPILLLPFT
ncbi:anti-sigma factor [Streptomyces tateyamensis]|uniref:Regulator of SigK n=1 Tax=Streptomyces tateyamensis TaxID=565073 RepID=A0A2V4N6V3_9ACTN|nr:anti-sigma factor [Streptomyces tateyamensis]PYC70175.1 anti-sigma factor [Streptomyces tateyamensis]